MTFCDFKGLDTAKGLSHFPPEIYCVYVCVCVCDTSADLCLLPLGWTVLFILFQCTAVYQYISDRFGCTDCRLISTML